MTLKWPLGAAALLRLFYIFAYPYISPDGTHYASLGARLAREFVFKSYGSQFPDIIQPPLYPFLIAPFTYLFPPDIAAKLVSLICGLLLVYVGYRFVLSVSNDAKHAMVGAWLIALHPAMLAMGSQVMSEGLYILLISAIIYCGWLVVTQGSLRHLLWSTLLFILAVLTRPEALLYFLLFQVLLAFAVWRKKLQLRWVWAHIAPILLALMLYGWWAQQELGYFTISPKLNFVRVQGRLAAHDMRLAILNGEKNPAVDSDRARYRLTADSSRIAANALLYGDASVRENILQTAEKIPLTGTSMFDATVKRAGHNLYLIAYKLAKGMVFPALFIVFGLLGFLQFWKKGRKGRAWLVYAGVVMLPLSAYLIAHVEERFLYLLVPILLPLFSSGFVELTSWLKKKLTFLEKGTMGVGMAVLFITLLNHYTVLATDMNSKTRYARMGQEIAQKEIYGKIAATRPQAVFFSGNNYSVLPFASLPELLVYFEHSETEYLLIEPADIKKRSDLRELVQSGHPYFVPRINRMNEEDAFILLEIKP